MQQMMRQAPLPVSRKPLLTTANIGPPPGLEMFGPAKAHCDPQSSEIAQLTDEVARVLFPWYVRCVEEKNMVQQENMMRVRRLTEQALCQQAMSQQASFAPRPSEFLGQRRNAKQSDSDAYSSGMGSSTIAASDADSIVSISSGDEDFEERSGKAKTTMMLRNIPNTFTRAMLADHLDKAGFCGSYDFVYLPIDHSTNIGFGYAFVNFTSCNGARHFKHHFHGYSEWACPCDKTCEVVWSQAHQGLEEHIDRLRNSPVMHESVPDVFKPAIYINGMRVPFPQPTKKPRAPRIRHQPPVREGRVA